MLIRYLNQSINYDSFFLFIFTHMTENHPLIEDILDQHRPALGHHYDKYRHHVYRVVNFTELLCDKAEHDSDTLAVAAAFHDIGIWTSGTFDYLAPSVALAKEYIAGKQLSLSEETVEQIISNHHKVTTYQDNKLAEAFRKADLVDLSLGIISHGVSGKEIAGIYDTFPGEWFHRFILGEIFKNALRHPLNPLPVMKW